MFPFVATDNLKTNPATSTQKYPIDIIHFAKEQKYIADAGKVQHLTACSDILG